MRFNTNIFTKTILTLGTLIGTFLGLIGHSSISHGGPLTPHIQCSQGLGNSMLSIKLSEGQVLIPENPADKGFYVATDANGYYFKLDQKQLRTSSESKVGLLKILLPHSSATYLTYVTTKGHVDNFEVSSRPAEGEEHDYVELAGQDSQEIKSVLESNLADRIQMVFMVYVVEANQSMKETGQMLDPAPFMKSLESCSKIPILKEISNGELDKFYDLIHPPIPTIKI